MLLLHLALVHVIVVVEWYMVNQILIEWSVNSMQLKSYFFVWLRISHEFTNVMCHTLTKRNKVYMPYHVTPNTSFYIFEVQRILWGRTLAWPNTTCGSLQTTFENHKFWIIWCVVHTRFCSLSLSHSPLLCYLCLQEENSSPSLVIVVCIKRSQSSTRYHHFQ